MVFEGYSDEEEARFMEVYEEWKKETDKKNKEKSNENESIGF